VAPELESSLRAWVEYYRDLGVYDFYRSGEPNLQRAETTSAEPDLTDTLVAEPAMAGEQARPAHVAVPVIPVREPQIPIQHIAPPSAPQSSASNRLVSFDQLAPLAAAPVPGNARPAALAVIRGDIGDCTRCPLAYAGRKTIVFGDGSPTARLMFVGEGPGAEEDAQGLPFVGKAGQLLNNMIAAMGLARQDVYIANIVKCRPPGNRVPEPVEAGTCSQFLLRQIDIVQPQVIVALGSTAATYLLGVKQSLGALRGRWHTCRGAKLAVTYHPAFLLRDPRQKADAWRDLQMVMMEMGLKPPLRT
jgi:uracil-DNA glycosylase